MSEAVVDSGPLIHLDEIRAGRALQVFRSLLVPKMVAAEVLARPDGPGAALLRMSNLRVISPSAAEQARASALERSLNLGLADVHALAVAEGRGCTLVTDDLDLRELAKALHIQPVGTIGVLVRAATMAILTEKEATDAVDALVEDSSLFITRPLLERAKRAIESSGASRRPPYA